MLKDRLAATEWRRSTGAVRVPTRTEPAKAIAEVELERHRVEVTRVPLRRVVDEAPAVR